MKKKTMITIGVMIGAGLGAGIITDILMKRAVKIEKEKQVLIENLRRFMKANNVGKHDYDTELYIRGLLLNGRCLNKKEMKELLEKAVEGDN